MCHKNSVSLTMITLKQGRCGSLKLLPCDQIHANSQLSLWECVVKVSVCDGPEVQIGPYLRPSPASCL